MVSEKENFFMKIFTTENGICKPETSFALCI